MLTMLEQDRKAYDSHNGRLASFPSHSQILSLSSGYKWEIKSGSGLGARLISLHLHVLSNLTSHCLTVCYLLGHNLYLCSGHDFTHIEVSWFIPLQVNTTYQGKGPIHIAVVLGFIPVLRTLLQFHPDLELEVYINNCMLSSRGTCAYLPGNTIST